MGNVEETTNFNVMYDSMMESLLAGAQLDLLPYGFVDDFRIRLKILKVHYDNKEAK